MAQRAGAGQAGVAAPAVTPGVAEPANRAATGATEPPGAPRDAPNGAAAAPGPAPQRRFRWWADPYWILGGFSISFFVVVSLRHPWNWDFGVHAATVERLAADFLRPGNPMVEDPASTMYYTPYSLLAGAVAIVTGWSGRTVLGVAAPFAMVLFLVGLRRFVQALTPDRWAPVLVLACMMLLWGYDPVIWSGFVSLFSVPLVAAYPSFMAFGATLLWWAGLFRALERPPGAVRFGLLGVLGAAIALTHAFTAVVAAFGAVGIVAYRGRRIDKDHWLALAAAAGLALLAVVAWPYYSFFSLAGSRDFDLIHAPLYRPHVIEGLVLGLVTLPALWIRFRHHPLDPLVVLFALSSMVVAAGWATDGYALGRVWPGVLVAGQIALGVELSRMGGWLRRTWVPVTACAMAVGFWFQCGNLVYGLPFSREYLPPKVRAVVHTTPQALDYSFVRSYAQRGDVVLTDDFYCVMTLPGYGLRMVVPAWPDPFLSDVAVRRADLQAMVAPSTPLPERRHLLARYHIRWIVKQWYAPWTPDTWGMPEVQFVMTGPEQLRLYRLNQV
jgi:hypothetical protein